MKILKRTRSLCPECYRVLDAEILEKDGRILIRKSCPEHGLFTDTYWSDAEEYHRMQSFEAIGRGVENPRTKSEKGCPFDCGLCPEHKSHTVLAIIDVTNRCNLNCPICFANAGASGYIYEPTKKTIFKIIDNLRANRPVPPVALQFSGGEPTLREDLPELIRYAFRAGFPHVEVNSNGIRLAEDLEYLKRLKDAGLSTVYLQFDGLTQEVYEKMRGLDLLPMKLKALENFRKSGHLNAVLVPTLINGLNQDQIGDIIFFGIENSDIVRAVNFQPVSITGRIDRDRLEKMRITLPDVMQLAEEQTEGLIEKSDFYPVSFVVPFARAVGAIKGTQYTEFTVHPHCGVATFVIVEDDEVVPINRLVDVEKFIEDLEKVYEEASEGQTTRANFDLIRSLDSVETDYLKQLIKTVMLTGEYGDLAQFMYRVVMIGGMHFMDAYNYDVDRVQRCCIHYGIPDGRIIPFCTMNTLHRKGIEKEYSTPLSEWEPIHENRKPNPS